MRRRAVVMLAVAPVALAMAGSSLRAESRTVRSGEVTLRATQTAPLRLRLDVHAPPPAKIVSIAGAVGPASLAAPPLTAYPAAGQLAAIYILIDTSDPARRRVVARKLKHIRAMLKQAKPHHRFGLARFDQELRVLVPLGAGPKAVEAALAKVKAVGLRTYFFEAAIEASRQLGAFKADRRALFILSDGKIEDVKTAYDVRALVAAARRAGVRIYGVGYSSSPVEPPAFQNLRVPAKETGGRFVKTGRRFELPREFLAAPFAALRGGGRAVFDLTPTRAARLSGQATARITVALEGGRTMVLTVPILLPELPIGGRIGRLLDKAKERRNLPYTIGAGVVALALLALLFRWLVKLRQRLREARDYVAPAAIAVLEFFDEAGSKFDMVKKSVSIGRREDNDISLANGSVSGYHATIHRKSDGSFIITDQDSENGVSINDEEVKIAELKDGDDVELGEVRFRFSVPKEA